MNKLIHLTLIILQIPFANAQVRLNVTLHQIEDIRITEVSCYKERKDLVVELSATSFATQPSFIRYELLQLEKNKTYELLHNGSRATFISDTKPAYLVQAKSGENSHQFTLRTTGISKSQCSQIKESIRLSIEPM